jgi:hypothetical protein
MGPETGGIEAALSTRRAPLIPAAGRLSFPPAPIGSYRSISENSDNQAIEIAQKPSYSQASDEGSIPFTRSNNLKTSQSCDGCPGHRRSTGWSPLPRLFPPPLSGRQHLVQILTERKLRA